MKRILLFIAALIFYGSAWAQIQAPNSVTMTISGNLADIPGDVELVYSDYHTWFIPIPMDGGRFSVSIECNPIEVVRINFRKKDGVMPLKDGYTYYGVALIFPEEGCEAVIEGAYKEKGDESDYTVSGAPMSERYCLLNLTKETLEKEAEKEFLAGSQDKESFEAIKKRLMDETTALYKDCLSDNADNLLGVECINYLVSAAGSLDEKRTLIAQVPERFWQNHMISFIRTELRSAEMEKDLTAVRPATVNQPDAQGVAVSLLETCSANKYTLLDFWASWCAPCIAEFPALTEAYALYSEKGFEIYAVSLDSDKTKWEAAMARYNTPWINVGDMQGWLNTACVEYGVTMIPDNFLLDSEGNVLARGLRGDELAKKLEELFSR